MVGDVNKFVHQIIGVVRGGWQYASGQILQSCCDIVHVVYC